MCNVEISHYNEITGENERMNENKGGLFFSRWNCGLSSNWRFSARIVLKTVNKKNARTHTAAKFGFVSKQLFNLLAILLHVGSCVMRFLSSSYHSYEMLFRYSCLWFFAWQKKARRLLTRYGCLLEGQNASFKSQCLNFFH